MNIEVSSLPSGGYGYGFPSVSVSPMTFLQVTKYLENVPTDPLDRYLFEIQNLIEEDKNILKCYIMDVDFLIFYKKLMTVSGDLSYNITVTCPDCGEKIKKKIRFNSDIRFNQIDRHVMEGAKINLSGNSYETIVPTVEDFFKVFEVYLRYRKIKDLSVIKIISLIKDFDLQGNQVESDILGATHNDITLLLMLKEIYFNHLQPINVYCPTCNAGLSGGERRGIAVSVDALIADFFRDICDNCPIDGSKVLFKQVRES